MNFLKLEKQVIPKEEALILAPKIFAPIGPENVRGSGAIEVENECLKVRFRYGDVNIDIERIPETEEEMQKMNLSFKNSDLIRFLEFKPDSFYKLLELSIENKNNSRIIELDNILDHTEIYVLKNGQDVEGSAVSASKKFIKLSAEPKTVAALLTTFHELGHIADPNLDSRGSRCNFQGLTKEEIASSGKEMIDQERYAWAYCLKELKPLLEGADISLEDLDVLIHKFSLGSYSDIISKNL